MKLLIMGTGPFAVPMFRALQASEHEIVCLVTRPDKIARGRKKAPFNPMREAAGQADTPVIAPESINSESGLAILDEHPADLFVVCDYGQILSNDALSKSKLGGINLHGSLLPKYRGAAPINWALINGDKVAGITVIHMTPRLDGGPMICRRSLDVGETEDAVQLEQRLSLLGVEAVMEAINDLASWDGESPIGELQAKELVTKAPRLKKSDGEIDWSQSSERIFNQVRALKPWPGTFSNLLREGKQPSRVIVHQIAKPMSEMLGDVSFQSPPPDHGAALSSPHGILVRTGDGILAIKRLQPAGKREMSDEEFSRGYGNVLHFG